MLRVNSSSNAAGATNYFFSYLERDSIGSPRWLGLGSELLGLNGETFSGIPTRDLFSALVNNINPNTGGQLTERHVNNRRCGYEFTNDISKSASILALVFDQRPILTAFRECNKRMMQEIESDMKTRVRVGGAETDRTVRNLCSLEIVHAESRPVAGQTCPQVHAHNYAFNAVFDPIEDKWKAGQFGDVKRDAPYYEARFNADFTAKLVGLGYRVERRGKSWEIASVPEAEVRRFSLRTAVIEEKAAELGIHDGKRKGELGAKTREGKAEPKALEQLRAEWKSMIPPETATAIQKAVAVPGSGSWGKGVERSPKAAVDFAIGHSFERTSVISERELSTAAIKLTLGAVPANDLENLIRNDPRLIRREVAGEILVTTHEVMKEEQEMIAFAREGRGTQVPIASGHRIKDPRLDEDQRAAVMHILTSTDRVVMLRGRAGTGKTTLMSEAVQPMKGSLADWIAELEPVTLLAPSADASRGVLRSEGFEKADTVAKFMQSAKLQEKAKGGILWVDEAGLLGTKTMTALFRIAKEIDARVVLSGDPGQHRSVERGDPLRLLQQYAGIMPARVETIHRQRGLYKSAIQHISDGNPVKGFDALDKLGWVHESHESDCHRSLAWNFATVLETAKAKAREVGQKNYTAIVVSPTHAEGANVTAAIRDELKRRGILKGPGKLVDRFEDLRFTDAEKASPHFYEAGMMVRFHQNVAGLEAGKMYQVLGRFSGLGVILSGLHALPLDHAERFTVFRKHEKALELCVGDTIRITTNGKTCGHTNNPVPELRPHALNNGATYHVTSLNDAHIVLSNGWKIPSGFGHLTHGYCTTSNASQGKTADSVFIAVSSNSFGAANTEQFYVSASRGRHECQIFTDDKQELRKHIERVTEKASAIDLVKHAEALEREAIHRLYRSHQDTRQFEACGEERNTFER